MEKGHSEGRLIILVFCKTEKNAARRRELSLYNCEVKSTANLLQLHSSGTHLGIRALGNNGLPLGCKSATPM